MVTLEIQVTELSDVGNSGWDGTCKSVIREIKKVEVRDLSQGVRKWTSEKIIRKAEIGEGVKVVE